jgi:tetratricopeptide (TPR) repeat protein
LAQACITFDFLSNLARHYHNVGLLGQAEETYLFMLDFEKDKEERKKAYFPLIQICRDQKKYDQCEKYALEYLKEYPDGEDRAKVLHDYVSILRDKGDLKTAAGMLLKKDRPISRELDVLAGNLFLGLEQFGLAEFYYTRAENNAAGDTGVTMKRAEALFLARQLEKAIPLFESLLGDPRWRGKAGYRLIQVYFSLEQNDRALKLYERLSEMEIEEHWVELVRETVEAEKYF